MLPKSLPSYDVAMLATVVFGTVLSTTGSFRDNRLHHRWRHAFKEDAAAFHLAFVWFALSYASFAAVAPGASCVAHGLQLVVAVPSLLVITLISAMMSRAMRPSWRLLPVAGTNALLVPAGHLLPRPVRDNVDRSSVDLPGRVRSWGLGPGRRIFAIPNEDLMLTSRRGQP
jgi:hypothetical protein